MTSLPPLVEPGPELSAAERARTVRQTLLPELGEIGQRRLAHARVLVMGAGGLGAPVLQYLAAAGVGSLAIVDDDDVDLSNLHRQVIHSAADVGTAKTDSARRRMHALNPGVEVQTHRIRLTEDNAADLLAGHHVVLDGTDNFATRYLVADTCAALGIPLVWASVLRFDAQVSVFWSRPPTPATGVTLRDLFGEPPPPGQVPSCAEAGVIGSLCGIVGSIMATEVIKLIAGIGQVLLGRVAVVDALSMRVHEIPLVARSQGVAPGSEPGGADEPARADGGAGHGPADPPGPGIAEASAGMPGRAGDDVLTGSAHSGALDLAGFRQLRDQAEPDAVVLLDVREPAEAAADALPGAVNVPVSTLTQAARGGATATAIQDTLAGADVPPAAHLVTYCTAGVRSAHATRLLTAAGRHSAVLEQEAVEVLRDLGEGV